MSRLRKDLREELRERALRARACFERKGNRFLGASLHDFELSQAGAEHELQVLCAILEAYEGQRGAAVFFEPHDPLRPVYEAADIVISHPALGYVTVEVKGHRAGELHWSDGEIHVPYGRGKSRKLKAVIRQARRQQRRLKSKLEAEEKTALKDGRRRCEAPPGTFVIAFPRIRQCDFDALPWAGNPLPREQLLFEEMLAPTVLRKRLVRAAKSAALGRGWKNPITDRHVRLVEHVLGGLPRGLRGDDRERPAGTLAGELSRLNESTCLRPDQRDLALRNLEGIPTLIRGVAGSGKSILLAKSLTRMVDRSEHPDEPDRPLRLLVTGFNRALIPLLREDVQAFAGMNHVALEGADVRFLHFEGVLRQMLRDEWGLEVPSFKDMSDEERFPYVLAQVQELFSDDPELEDSHLFDHIFVDEAQDLHHEALRLLARLARIHPETGERGIAIYYDDAQNLYGKPRPRWKELGIHVIGRSDVMTECRRTSRPIVTFAFNLLLGATLPEQQRAKTRQFADVRSLEEKGLVFETDEGLVVEFAERPGRAPELLVFESEEEEVEQIVALVGELVGREKLDASEIIIQSRQWKPLRALRAALEASGHPCHLVGDARDEHVRQEGRVTLSTIKSAKGYDAPVTLMMAAQSFGTDAESRAGFYVGATRAQLRLYVTASSEGPLLDEIRQVLQRLPRLNAYLR